MGREAERADVMAVVTMAEASAATMGALAAVELLVARLVAVTREARLVEDEEVVADLLEVMAVGVVILVAQMGFRMAAGVLTPLRREDFAQITADLLAPRRTP